MKHDRSQGIGASEIAAVLGISPYQTAWEVYARKKGLLEPLPQTERMRWGVFLQKAIAQAFTVQTGKKHRWYDKPVAHKGRKWQFATPDGFVYDSDRPPGFREILEVKNISLDQSGAWDRYCATEDGIPDYYACQCHWLMSVLELPACWMACLIGGNDFRVYHLERNEEIEAVLIEEGWRFVQDHLYADVPPPMGGSPRAAEWLKRRFPQERENIRPAQGQEIAWLDEYAILRSHQDILGNRRDELENEIKQAIGESEGLEWTGGKFTWKKTKDGSEIDWEALAISQIKDFTKEEQTAFLEQFTHIKHGTRRIYFKAREIPPGYAALRDIVQSQYIQTLLKDKENNHAG